MSGARRNARTGSYGLGLDQPSALEPEDPIGGGRHRGIMGNNQHRHPGRTGGSLQCLHHQLARLFRFMMPVTGARPLGSTRIIVGVAAVIRAFIAWDILTRFQTPLVVRMPVGDWLPEPDSLAIQLVVGVWLGSAIAFTIGYRVTESGITAPWRQGLATRPLEGL